MHTKGMALCGTIQTFALSCAAESTTLMAAGTGRQRNGVISLYCLLYPYHLSSKRFSQDIPRREEAWTFTDGRSSLELKNFISVLSGNHG